MHRLTGYSYAGSEGGNLRPWEVSPRLGGEAAGGGRGAPPSPDAGMPANPILTHLYSYYYHF